MNPAQIHRIASKIAGVVGSVYLLFTSASGAVLWTLPPGSNTSQLKAAADKYNDTAAWEARGNDGTAYVFTDQELVQHFAEDDSSIESIEDIYGNVDGHGDINMEKAMDMLEGRLDGLLG